MKYNIIIILFFITLCTVVSYLLSAVGNAGVGMYTQFANAGSDQFLCVHTNNTAVCTFSTKMSILGRKIYKPQEKYYSYHVPSVVLCTESESHVFAQQKSLPSVISSIFSFPGFSTQGGGG